MVLLGVPDRDPSLLWSQTGGPRSGEASVMDQLRVNCRGPSWDLRVNYGVMVGVDISGVVFMQDFKD